MSLALIHSLSLINNVYYKMDINGDKARLTDVQLELL